MASTYQSAPSFRPAVTPFAMAAAAALAALGLGLALGPALGRQGMYLPFALAVIVAGRFGGLGPALAAGAFSIAGIWYFFLEPRHSFLPPDPDATVGLALFAVVAAVAGVLFGQIRHHQGDDATPPAAPAGPDNAGLRRAERALRESEERLNFATQAAGIGVWFWTPGTSHVVVSGNWRQLFGVPPDGPVTFETWRAAVHPDDRDHALHALNTAADNQRDFDVEYRVLWPDGTVRWLADRGRASYDPSGRAIGMAGVNIDITELKRSADTVRQQMAVLAGINRIFGEALSCDTEEKLGLACLAVAEEVTASQAGFIGKLGPHGRLDDIAISDLGWDACRLDLGSPRKIPAGFAIHGIYGRVLLDEKGFYTNDPASHPDRIGTLQGHPPLTAFLGAPLVEGGKTIGMVGLANRQGGYRDQDLQAVEALSSAIVQVFLQRRSQEARRESEDRLRALADSLPEAALFRYREDIDGTPHIDFMTAGIERMTGVPAAEYRSDAAAVERNILPEDHDRLHAAISTSRERLSRFEIEVRHRHRTTGEIRWSLMRSTPSRNPDGSTTWDGIEFDITGRKHAQAAVAESQARLQAALGSMSDAVFISDLDGRFVEFNHAFATFHRFASKDECARTFAEYPGILDMFFPDGTPAPVPMWAVPRALRGETVTNAEYRLRRKDTGETWVGSYSFSPIRDKDGTIVGSVVVGRDVTALKEADEALRTLNAELESRVHQRTAQLEAANQELEAFAYSVSHDLRAPLRGIDGWSLALVEDYRGALDERACQYLDRVRGETQRMGMLIDDLLQLSRITRAGMERDTVDLTSLARTVSARLAEAHHQRQIEFVIGAGLTGLGDARLLDIALTNLFGNAVKFTGPRARARIEFGIASKDGRPFYVRDNGVGFDMAFAGTLFGAFQRLHKASEFPGTGVGLATVQRIIHRHGGRVWAEAAPDHGATFYFTLGGQ